ncbi:MAG: hypothetical protein GX815_11065 [Clostridiales bacterium]|nr:hypothetical protein [Clostridiales bacterium]
MDKFTHMAVLLDVYGGLLTDKQQDVMEQYYSYDLSLQEIAENAGITKQGVHDLIRRAEHTLIKTDEKLGFISRLTNIQQGLGKLQLMLDSISRQQETLLDSLDSLTQQQDKIGNISESKSSEVANIKSVSESTSSKVVACREEIENIINTCLGG